jgi:hypothetical protein
VTSPRNIPAGLPRNLANATVPFVLRWRLMQHRTFEDRNGVVWRVARIPADAPDSGEVRDRRRRPRGARPPEPTIERLTDPITAWLHFASRSENRIVSSVPSGWLTLPEAELEDLLAYSRPFSRKDRLRWNAFLNRETS